MALKGVSWLTRVLIGSIRCDMAPQGEERPRAWCGSGGSDLVQQVAAWCSMERRGSVRCCMAQ
jgi:hypothetical protein